MFKYVFPAPMLALTVGLGLAVPVFAADSPSAPPGTFRLSDPNPALSSDFGWGRFRLPSLRIDIGSSIPMDQTLQSFTAVSKTVTDLVGSLSSGQTVTEKTAQDTKTQLGNLLKPFQTGARLDYEADIALLSFAGSPLWRVADKPLSLGLHVGAETRGYVSANFSKTFSDGLLNLANATPALISTGSNLAGLVGNANQLTGQVTALTTNIAQLTTEGTQLLQNPLSVNPARISELTTLVQDISQDLDQIKQPAQQLTKAVTDSTKTAQGLLNTLQSASSGGVKLESANDLHVTVALSGAYPVYESEDIQVSLGTNLKLFLLPFNVPVRNFGLNSDASLMGQIKINEFSGFKNIASLQSTLTSLEQAAGDVDKLITEADSVKTQLDKTLGSINTGNLAAIAQPGLELISTISQASQSFDATQKSVNAAFQNISSIQQTLTSELQQLSLKGSIVTPEGAGFGMDLGVHARLFKHLKLDLHLQNPVVVWQGTERPFEGRLVNATGQIQPTLNFLDNQSKKVNYNATVPLALLLRSQYSFDGVLPEFQGLNAHGQFEFVNNGRTPGLTLGLQKQFGPAYAGLGGRLGGISSMLYGEAGLRLAGNFGLDLQLGVAPAGTGVPVPGVSWLNSAVLGMYLQF
jgi:uncharacterized protein YoxC